MNTTAKKIWRATMAWLIGEDPSLAELLPTAQVVELAPEGVLVIYVPNEDLYRRLTPPPVRDFYQVFHSLGYSDLGIDLLPEPEKAPFPPEPLPGKPKDADFDPTEFGNLIRRGYNVTGNPDLFIRETIARALAEEMLGIPMNAACIHVLLRCCEGEEELARAITFIADTVSENEPPDYEDLIRRLTAGKERPN